MHPDWGLRVLSRAGVNGTGAKSFETNYNLKFQPSKTRKKGTKTWRLRRHVGVRVFRVLEGWNYMFYCFSNGFAAFSLIPARDERGRLPPSETCL